LIIDQLTDAAQRDLLATVCAVLDLAPPFQPVMPGTGQPFSVRMTNCGPMGWVSDIAGYRYQATHPVTGQAWPRIPDALLDLWRTHLDAARMPDACLINLYHASARMGLHVDDTEADLTAPVLSVSLGDTAVFRLGGTKRTDPTRSFRLASGAVMALRGDGRLRYHGVDRVLAGSSDLLGSLPGDLFDVPVPHPALAGVRRINVTLRVGVQPTQ
jgi:alkylated DNA repair protein (DNA oxidative demethylase)